MDRYAVVGHPIEHSKSPMIHAMFAKQTEQSMTYGKIEAPLDGFEACVLDFFASSDGKGLNVTVPFKEQAWALCTSRTERAELAGAVNTLFLDEKGQIRGDNTDGIGLVSDLKNHGIELKDKKILIVGAGGAVRGVLQTILKELPKKLVICNRTQHKADTLAETFGGLGAVASCSFDAFSRKMDKSEDGVCSDTFDLVINGTSASLTGKLPPISSTVIAEHTVSYDMMYGSSETVFNHWARDAGAAQSIDGLGMLVEQAAEAFSIWRACVPQTDDVMVALRTL